MSELSARRVRWGCLIDLHVNKLSSSLHGKSGWSRQGDCEPREQDYHSHYLKVYPNSPPGKWNDIGQIRHFWFPVQIADSSMETCHLLSSAEIPLAASKPWNPRKPQISSESHYSRPVIKTSHAKVKTLPVFLFIVDIANLPSSFFVGASLKAFKLLQHIARGFLTGNKICNISLWYFSPILY